ncbi:KTSC domain-containing protein [Urechidicola vernalis]|uniref:KTSC domain-containing protein n=1 Tax=Urechidicola vernalis TaxID=3075600 RepID=A0ABU2Y2W2_9FLAO|nr:KTSC domain-containing protein [Urechidicola sp. P050]MDT0551984.1 KTSC domain-containing protein [Urechidicola sp. P050]
MKRINQYKKLFKVEGTLDLKELKKTYRGLVKEYHPDKFQDEEEKEKAGVKSLEIIDGYHFLVSIAPETKEANSEEYATTISQAQVADFQHKSMRLEITFTNGDTYEYFGVNQKLFNKFAGSKSLSNFGKRKIFNSFTYRKIKKADIVA